MPRETIVTPTPNEVFEAKVGWERDRDVQVGVTTVDGKSLAWQLFGTSRVEVGRLLVDLLNKAAAFMAGKDFINEAAFEEECVRLASTFLDSLDAIPGLAYEGVWANLDRRGCNDLIRILRRARDAAFGRDE